MERTFKPAPAAGTKSVSQVVTVAEDLLRNFVHSVAVVNSITTHTFVVAVPSAIYYWLNGDAIGATGVKTVARRTIPTLAYKPVVGAFF